MTRRFTTALWVALLLAACGDAPPIMLGEHNVLVVAPDALWAEVGDSLRSALRVRPPGLPPESPFELTRSPPDRTDEEELQRFRQIVVMGSRRDSLVARILDNEPPAGSPTSVLRRADVWRAGQTVFALALPEEAGPDAALARLPELATMVRREFRRWNRWRMYSMGLDDDLTATLDSAGVELAVPALYRWLRPSDSTFVFATRSQDLDPLVRSVLLTWQPLDDDEMSVSGVLEWRQQVADRHYAWEHETRPDPLEIVPLDTTHSGGLEVRGAWDGVVDGLPHGGPFMTRAVDCPDQGRRYLLDAWVFAPNRGKYRYLLQLEEVLDSFDCPSVDDPGAPPSG